jgi:50S ribosomal protein L16 3-hydroxylase
VPGDSADSCLARLFGRDDFLERAWPGRPMVAHGPLARFGELGALPQLADLPLLLSTHKDLIRVALADKRDEHSSVEVDGEKAAALHGDGLALILNAVERFLPPVQTWLEGLRVELGLPRKCDPRSIIYASPPGSGNSPHFDANANFVVQIRGLKRWRVAPNRHVVNPTDRWAMNEGGLSEELEGYVDGPLPAQMPDDATTYELVAGSVLFVPRGFWHETESDEDSLALNFTFGQPTWADVVLGALRIGLLEDPQWRELADGLGDHRPERAGAALLRLEAMIGKLAPSIAGLEPEEIAAAANAQTVWLLAPRAFLRIEDGAAIASVGAETFEIDVEPGFHQLLEWIGSQRTPFSLGQVGAHFPMMRDALPELLRVLASQGLLDLHLQ